MEERVFRTAYRSGRPRSAAAAAADLTNDAGSPPSWDSSK